MIAEGHIFLGEMLELAVVVDLLLDNGRLRGGDALVELLSVEEALENEVGPLSGLGGTGLEELFAQRAAAQAVDGLHVLEDEVALLEKGVE